MRSQARTGIATLAAFLLGVPLVPRAALADEPATQQVRVTTNMGEFVIEVRSERAPLTAVASTVLLSPSTGYQNKSPATKTSRQSPIRSETPGLTQAGKRSATSATTTAWTIPT